MGCEIWRDDDAAEFDDHVVVGGFGLGGVPAFRSSWTHERDWSGVVLVSGLWVC
jgi:hypothetical protein